jgi:hypothetical protein
MLNIVGRLIPSTRTIAIAILIANVIGIQIGLAGLQRAQAIREGSCLDSPRIAQQQLEELDRIHRLLVDADERVNDVQILLGLQRGPLGSQIKDIQARITALQAKIEASTSAK